MDGGGSGHRHQEAIQPRSWKRENLAQRAYDHFSSRLLRGAMLPGEKLILRPLASQLGLSPTPVREALLRLVSEQALVLGERGSITVPVMTDEQFGEMSEMRSDLEARATERAVRNAEPSDLDTLERLSIGTVKLWNNRAYEEMLVVNARFHRQICVIGGSELIQHALEGLWIRIGPLCAMALRGSHALSMPGLHPHERLVAALRTRNIEAARAASRQDVQATSDFIRASLAGDLPVGSGCMG